MDKYKEFYISSLVSLRLRGWMFAIMFPLFTIALWLFAKPELWSLNSKIGTTIVMGIITYGMGIREIKKANKELSELK